jgi:hypothetical protein
MTARSATVAAQTGTGLVLLTLASGQFLMTLDSSVMNVSIATVAKDLGTDVTGGPRAGARTPARVVRWRDRTTGMRA